VVLFVELKTKEGWQSEDQVEFEKKIISKYPDEVKKRLIIFDTQEKASNKFREANFRIYSKNSLKHILTESPLIKKLNRIDLLYQNDIEECV